MLQRAVKTDRKLATSCQLRTFLGQAGSLPLRESDSEGSATSVVAASPDGRMLAYEDDSGTIHLVLAKDGHELRTFDFAGTGFSQLTFSPDSQRLAGGGATGDQVRVAIWDIADGNVVRDWKWPKGRDPHSHVESLCFRPDGQQIAAAVFRQLATGDLTLAIRWLSSSTEKSTVSLSVQTARHSRQPGGTGFVRFWETSGGELQRQINVAEGRFKGDDHRMYTVCYSPIGGLIATAHLNGQVRIWNAADMELLKEFEVKGRFVYGCISFSPDGS